MEYLRISHGNGMVESGHVQDRREMFECDEVPEKNFTDYDGDVVELALKVRTEILQWRNKLPSLECLCDLIDKWKEDWF